MNSHYSVLMSAGVFAVAAVVVGLLALHLKNFRTAVALVMVGGLGLGTDGDIYFPSAIPAKPSSQFAVRPRG